MDGQNPNSKNYLPISIIIAAVVLSGALVFLGSKMSGNNLKAQVKLAIDEYSQEQQKKYAEAQAAAQKEETKPKFVENYKDFIGNGAMEGSKNAKVTIIEFSDFQCPYCGKFYSGAYSQIKSEYIDKGRVILVFRHLPLSFHPGAFPAALAAECARDQGGDEAFFKMHDKLFGNQETLFNGSTPVDTGIKNLANSLGLNMNKFNSCYDNQKFKDAIEKDSEAATKAGIRGTPGFIINGQIVSGAMPFASFKSIIDAELAK